MYILCECSLLDVGRCRLMTQKEYIIPLAFDSKSFSLFNTSLPANQLTPIREGISSLEQSVSIRPRVVIDRSACTIYVIGTRLFSG